MSNAIAHISALDDAAILSLVASLDRLERPIARRFEGDDADIVALMTTLGLHQTLADKLLIGGLILREAVHRGLTLTRTPN